jgi:hypothetical protein
MATHPPVTRSAGQPDGSETLDKSSWTELQHIQYLLGIWDGQPGSPVVPRPLPKRTWVPNDRWQRGRGMLSDHPEHDTSEMKARERAWEEEHDARKFGWSR